jgi:hypothetical protein
MKEQPTIAIIAECLARVFDDYDNHAGAFEMLAAEIQECSYTRFIAGVKRLR